MISKCDWDRYSIHNETHRETLQRLKPTFLGIYPMPNMTGGMHKYFTCYNLRTWIDNMPGGIACYFQFMHFALSYLVTRLVAVLTKVQSRPAFFLVPKGGFINTISRDGRERKTAGKFLTSAKRKWTLSSSSNSSALDWAWEMAEGSTSMARTEAAPIRAQPSDRRPEPRD